MTNRMRDKLTHTELQANAIEGEKCIEENISEERWNEYSITAIERVKVVFKNKREKKIERYT